MLNVALLGSFAAADYVVTPLARAPGGLSNLRGDEVDNFPAQIRLADGAVVPVPPLPGDAQDSLTSINNVGDVAGASNPVNGGSRAFVRFNDGTQMQVADSPSEAWAISDSGQVVGQYGIGDATHPRYGFSWTRSGGLHLLDNVQGPNLGIALHVNQPGDVAGVSSFSTPPSIPGAIPPVYTHAVLWTGGSATPTDLGTLPNFTDSSAIAMNDIGEVSGLSGYRDKNQGIYIAHPVVWDAAHQIHDLGLLPGESEGHATSMNNRGAVVGVNYNTGATLSQYTAFLWTQQDGLQGLDSLLAPGSRGWHLINAGPITDSGQIYAEAGVNGQYVSVLLTPSMPEPQSVALLVAAACLLRHPRRVGGPNARTHQ